jgi:hypothetical protein
MVAIGQEGMKGISFFRKHSVHDVGLPMDGCVRMKTFPVLVTLF